MNASKPFIIDNKQFDRYALNLIISGTYDANGHPEASVVCNLTPLRIEGDTVETAPDAMVNIRLGSLSQADPATLAAVTAIQTAIQTYLASKGI